MKTFKRYITEVKLYSQDRYNPYKRGGSHYNKDVSTFDRWRRVYQAKDKTEYKKLLKVIQDVTSKRKGWIWGVEGYDDPKPYGGKSKRFSSPKDLTITIIYNYEQDIRDFERRYLGGAIEESVKLDEVIYPDSFLKNRKLMDLVKSHNDPMNFLLDVITLMSKGQLRVAKIGAASTREIAALWNDFKNKKIPTAESLQIDEGRLSGAIMWKKDMDFENPEIQVFGLGVYTLDTLRKNIAMKLEDLAKNTREGRQIDWLYKQITDERGIIHNLVTALFEVEEELNKPANKGKITKMKRQRDYEQALKRRR